MTRNEAKEPWGPERYRKDIKTERCIKMSLDSLIGRASLTRSASCSVVCPCEWPVWSWDRGRGKPWSESSYASLTAWGCWESGGGQPALEWNGKYDLVIISADIHRGACVWSHPVQQSLQRPKMYGSVRGMWFLWKCASQNKESRHGPALSSAALKRRPNLSLLS